MFYYDVITKDIINKYSKHQFDCNIGDFYALYISLSDFKYVYNNFDFSEKSYLKCIDEKDCIRSNIDVYDNYYVCVISIIEPASFDKQTDRIAVYIKKNLFLVVKIRDTNDSTLNIFENAVVRFNENINIERIIFSFFDLLIYKDNQKIELIEKRITSMEENFQIFEKNNLLNTQIFIIKRRLLECRDYYDQLINLGEVLISDEIDIFEKKNVRYFKIFTEKVGRLRDYSWFLTEMTVHLREAYDSALDINLNHIMKLFTVITTIFLPLTLIAGWYGMNFTNMPLIKWRYGYLTIICVSILVVSMIIMYFKKRKFL